MILLDFIVIGILSLLFSEIFMYVIFTPTANVIECMILGFAAGMLYRLWNAYLIMRRVFQEKNK